MKALKAQQPQVEIALKNISKELPDAQGRNCLNPDWLRARAKVNFEDKQALHAAAVIPTDAVNKETENLAKTAEKAPDCVGNCYAIQLLPERIMQKNYYTGNEEAVGIQESCVNCYNRKHGTAHKDKAFERMAEGYTGEEAGTQVPKACYQFAAQERNHLQQAMPWSFVPTPLLVSRT